MYIGKVEAMLGQDEYMEEKIANLRAILKKMGNESGTLHLESFTGKNDTATFRPSDEPETETETETDAAGDTGGDDTSAAGDVGTALIHRRPGMRQSEMTRTAAVRLLPMITWMAARTRQEIRLRQSAWYLIPRERLCTMFM